MCCLSLGVSQKTERAFTEVSLSSQLGYCLPDSTTTRQRSPEALIGRSPFSTIPTTDWMGTSLITTPP
jgi:hypothetical protein